MSEVVVPNGWSVATIMDVATPSGGGTPSKSDSSYWVDGTLPWVSPKDMKVFLITSSEDQVTIKALGRLTLIPENSVLVVVRSGILSRTLPVAINQIPVTVNQDMRAFVPETGMDARYIAWQLISRERDILDSCAKDGTTVASIEGPALAAYPLAIAPAAEQTRIVEKLEELLSDLDAGVAELEAAQRKLAQYRQSLLKAAVEGALTADWRAARHGYDYPPRSSSPRKRWPIGLAHQGVMDSRFHGNDGQSETGADLLQRILTERRARWEARQLAKFAEQGKTPAKDWQAKYPEPAAPDTTDLPALPYGWVWACVEQLGDVQLGRQRSPDKLTGTNPAKYIRAANITEQGIDFSDVLEMDFNETEMKTFRLHVGDVLLTEASGSPEHVGRPVIWPEVDGAYCFQNTVIRFAPIGIASAYAFRTFQASQKLGMFQKLAGGVGINHLSAGKFARHVIPLPPSSEQEAVVSTLESALSAVDEQEQAIQHGLNAALAQRKNILKAAFAGQLVPQDPNDEPASVLLERIRAERAAQGTSGKKRGRTPRTSA